MDIQTRKIEFVKEFLKIQNEELLTTLEKLLGLNQVGDATNPMTAEELNQRIDQAMKDSSEGRLTESSILREEIKQWS